jgi:serine/threonine protein kinase HipA of HipAB toxin-antitoxin module
MIDFEARLSKLETDVAAMKEKVSFFTVIYEKFDKTLEKLDERQNDDRKELQAMMDELRTDIVQEMKALREDMAAQHNVEKQKIEDLNKWRWLVMGGAVVVGWIISRLGLPFEIK